MGENPRFEFPADPAKGRYGPVAQGLKGLVDGLSRATGMSGSAVVAAMVVAFGLSLAVVSAAVIVIARDTAPARPEPVTDYVPGGPPPPDRAALNADSFGPSPAPTNILGDDSQTYASGQEGTPPTSASFDGGRGAQNIPLSSFLKLGGRTGQADSTAYGSEPPSGGSDAGEEPKEGWMKPKPWLLKERSMPQVKESFGGTQKSQQSSTAQSGGGSGGAGLSNKAAARAGRYAGEIPSVPEISNGVTVGAESPDPRRRDDAPGQAPAVKNPKGKVEGPVKQEKMPDVGPGVQVNNVQSGGSPTGQPRISAGSGGDILSVPVDVNRIQVEANRANDVDRSPGINTIGK